MYFFKKYKVQIILFIAIVALFWISRLYNLTALPIFTDEAIYIRWAQIAKNDASWRFISLTDGKQPLFIWIIMIIMRFVSDPLLSGRLVSTAAGFLTLIGMFFLGREIFRNKWTGIISSLLYLIFPMALVYDRMALYDSLVGTFAVWSLYFEILLIRKGRLDIALILGMIIGAGVLTKTNAFFNIYLLPFSLLLFNWTSKMRWTKLFKWIGLAALTTIIAYGYYSILRLSPFSHIIAEKNALFVYPFEEWIKHPFTFFWGNLMVGQKDWVLTYMTLPLFIMAIVSFLFYKSFNREKVFLFIWFIIPFFALALFGKVLYPRFIFFMLLPLLPLVSFSFYNLYHFVRNKKLFYIVSMLIVFFSLRSDFLILTNFNKASIPEADLNQYSNDWPAGGGVKEAVDFFKKESQKGKIFIGTEGTFGLMPASLEIYLNNNPNIQIMGFWPIDNIVPKELLEINKKMPTYFVFYQPCNFCKSYGEAPDPWPVSLVFQYKKYNEGRFFSIYKVNP